MDAERLKALFQALGNERIREGDEWIHTSCPLAPWTHEKGTDNCPSLSVHIALNDISHFYCFSCSEHGTLVWLFEKLNMLSAGAHKDILDYVIEQEKQDLATVCKRKADFKCSNISKQAQATGAAFRGRLPGDTDPVWDDSILNQYKGKVPKYIINRGIPIEVCKEWELGYDKKEQRVVFPFRRNIDGAFIGMTGRSIIGVNPMYRTYDGFHIGRFFYGEHRLELAQSRIILVEGPIDLLKLWVWGYRNVLALCGVAVTADRIKKLMRWGLPLYMVLDWDRAGDTSRKVLKNELYGAVKLWDVEGPRGKDPDELSANEFEECFKSAKFVLGRA